MLWARSRFSISVAGSILIRQKINSTSSSGDGHFTNRLPLLQIVRGIHQCLVAEIRFQPGATDPIPAGASPASSDRLAQRNLAIMQSDNPGTAETHVVQHTVLVKPSKVGQETTGALLSVGSKGRETFDELVIRWNNLPRDTKATLFFPEWNVDDVLLLASVLRQGPSLLKKVDAHTHTASLERSVKSYTTALETRRLCP